MSEKTKLPILKTNIKRQLELLGDLLYKEPFLSGLKEAIKNSIEQGATEVDVEINSHDTTILIEKGGTGINPERFDETLGTIFTESKDKQHFGIGRLGLILSHDYADVYSVWKGILHHWRMYSDGSYTYLSPEVANVDFSVKFVCVRRKRNNVSEKDIEKFLTEYFGLPLNDGLILKLNNKKLVCPFISPNHERVEFKSEEKDYCFDIYWSLSSPKDYSMICENGVGVRRTNISGITVYINQNGYLKTKLDREDFQRDKLSLKFLKEVRNILVKIVPRKQANQKILDEMWAKLFSKIRSRFYKIIQTENKRRKGYKRGEGKERGTMFPKSTRKTDIDEGYNAPFLWYNMLTQEFEFNRSHPITILITERQAQRKGRLDTLIVPIERCFFLIQALESKIDLEELKSDFVKSDKQTGETLKRDLRLHNSVEEQIAKRGI